MRLFTVGPVEMDEAIKEYGGAQIPYFRTEDFSNVMKNIEGNFKMLTGAPEDARVLVLTASGTGAMEAAVSNVLCKEDKVLVINGGSFGERFVQLCQCFDVPYEEIKIPFGATLSLSDLEPYRGKGFSALLVNLHETSTGQLYDGEMLSQFCRDENLIFIIDAISTLFADPFNMRDLAADVVISSSQKALALPPGLSFLVLSQRAQERVMGAKPVSMYFDLKDYLKNMDRGQTPFTPAVGIIMQLNLQLEHMAAEGIENIIHKHKERAEYFRAKCVENGIKVAAFPKSNALTTVEFDKGNAYEVFLELKNNYDLMLTPSGGSLSNRILRVGHLGNLKLADFDEVVRCLKEVM